MAARSIASLSLSFGLVSIPVKLYSATESSSGVSFNLLHTCGSRVKQQYLCLKENVVVERADMVKGYEFEKDRYVMFKPDELKTLENAARHTIDIVAFIPLSAVDPIYYDKAYFLAPDKRGAKPYGLLLEAMRESGRCALARWAWKGKEYVVQVRANDDGIVLQQLLYADEVRSMKDLDIEKVDVQKAELNLALQLISQIAAERLRPGRVCRRGKAAHSRRDRPEDRRQRDRRIGCARARQRPDHRPDGSVARQPGRQEGSGGAHHGGAHRAARRAGRTRRD